MYNSTPFSSSNQRVISGQDYVQKFWEKERRAVETQGCDMTTVQAAQYAPWNPSIAKPNVSPVMSNSYPNEEDMSSLYMRGGNGGCALSVDSLMPGSWRGGNQASMQGPSGGSCSSIQSQNLWAKYAPTKGAYQNYITAAGSARLSLNTRSALSRNIGLPNLLRQAPAVPISSQAILFNDSDYRQDAYYQATGAYPALTQC